MNRRRLIVFTRYPEPGRAKTRLIGALGPQGAADLHRRMTERTVATARDAGERLDADVEIRFDGGDERRVCQWLGVDLRTRRQVGGDLGEKMANAFRVGFDEGCCEIILVGTDCPELTVEVLARAFAALRQHDVVPPTRWLYARAAEGGR